jgi:carboxymethylenebutenolidase
MVAPAATIVADDVLITRKRAGKEPLPGYHARPKDGFRLPAVVIVHELFGINDNIRDITRRFAEVGYAALAVDLMAHGNRKVCIMRLFAALALRPYDNRGLDEIRLGLRWLQAHPDVDNSKGAVIGFCMGGGYALAAACVEQRFLASSAFYGFTPRPVRRFKDACPIVGSYPEQDNFTVGQSRTLARTLEKYGIAHDLEIYPGAQHSFFNNDLDAYDPAASADAWRRTLAFFAEHLELPERFRPALT